MITGLPRGRGPLGGDLLAGTDQAPAFSPGGRLARHPLPEELEAVWYGLTRGDRPGGGGVGPYLPEGCLSPGGIGVLFFSRTATGRRRTPGTPPTSFSRNAYNFTAALYDAGSETLYYYELDT